MRSPISQLAALGLLLTTIVPAGRAQEPEVSYFSFVNAIATTEPTILTVNGKKIGDPFPPGFYTGGMGFIEKVAAISVKNGDLPPKQGSIALSPLTSPIIISFLKVEEPPPGSAEPKKTIQLLAIPCATTAKSRQLRAVYVAPDGPPLDVTIVQGRGGPDSASSQGNPTLTLKPRIPLDIPTNASPLTFYVGNKAVGAHDNDSKENFLLIFYVDPAGKIGMTEAVDSVIR